MRSPQKIIRLMITSGRYLGHAYMCEKFMCNAVTDAKKAGIITTGECRNTINFIGEVLEQHETLTLYFARNGVLKRVSGQPTDYFGLRGNKRYVNDLRLQFWAFLLWFKPGI